MLLGGYFRAGFGELGGDFRAAEFLLTDLAGQGVLSGSRHILENEERLVPRRALTGNRSIFLRCTRVLKVPTLL